MTYSPPFSITPEILNEVAYSSEQVGGLVHTREYNQPQLQRQNRIKTITGTLAIEGNTLSEKQVTAILDGKRVLGDALELAEVQGAIQAYNNIESFKPYSVDELLRAHRLMMGEVLSQAGCFRTTGVGIQRGDQVVHVAPPGERIPDLMNNLYDWVRTCDIHPLIRSAVFHYEFEFIHPFADGNGRMGRLWHTLLLAQWHSLFYSLPLESVIRDHQAGYYEALSASDTTGDCTLFVIFMLGVIRDTLEQSASLNASLNAPLNIEHMKTPEAILSCIAFDKTITRKRMAEYIGKDIRTIGRALKHLQERGVVTRIGSDKTGHWEITDA